MPQFYLGIMNSTSLYERIQLALVRRYNSGGVPTVALEGKPPFKSTAR
jgi:hypothetical protein